jgi:glycosyltransferase involved in cell wall biosynthesis
MLVPYPTIQGPLPKLVPLLVDHLRALGCHIETEHWSAHAEGESPLQKAVGRARDLARVRARLRGQRFDVMYIVTAHNRRALARDVPLILATWRLCPHRVLQFHGSDSHRLRAPGHTLLKLASRMLVGACDVTLVLSREEQDQWSAFCPGARFEVVANPFTPAMTGSAHPPTAQDGVHGDGGHPPSSCGDHTLLFVGRLMPEKGVFDLVRAVVHLNATMSCRLVIVGDGPSADALAREVSELGIADWVELRGYLSGEDLARCYREADAFALPTYWAEGFPTVLLEAMSMGLPVVTTRLRGAADRLEEGVHALFVPPRSPQALAAALHVVLTDDRLRASMAASNAAKVREFAPEVVVPQYVAILNSVVGAPSTGLNTAVSSA